MFPLLHSSTTSFTFIFPSSSSSFSSSISSSFFSYSVFSLSSFLLSHHSSHSSSSLFSSRLSFFSSFSSYSSSHSSFIHTISHSDDLYSASSLDLHGGVPLSALHPPYTPVSNLLHSPIHLQLLYCVQF